VELVLQLQPELIPD